jgi:hypothetical protein
MNFLKKLKDVIFGRVPDTSTPGKVDSTDLAKVARTSIFIGLSSALAFLLQNVDPSIFGSYKLIVVTAGTAALEFLTKLTKG